MGQNISVIINEVLLALTAQTHTIDGPLKMFEI